MAQVRTRAGLQVTFLPLLRVLGLAWCPPRALVTAPMALSGAPTTGSRAAAPGGPRPKDWALTVWAHQGPVDAGAVTGYAERARAPSHSEQSPRSPAMPTALPRLPQASRPKVPVPCQSAGGQPYQSLQSRRTTSAGASTREALELGRPQRQEEMGTQRPSCTRWPGGQRQPGGGGRGGQARYGAQTGAHGGSLQMECKASGWHRAPVLPCPA